MTFVLKHTIHPVLQKQLSAPGAKEPAAKYNSLEHYLEVDGGTAEDCEDVVATGHISCTWHMPHRLTFQPCFVRCPHLKR